MPHAIDLRSDTVTRPTPPMRAAIAEAEVGDDVFGDDAVFGEEPTVNELQREIAARLGKEAALFVPSGSMSNQIALRVHCRPGEEFLCESGCHIYNYEQGDGPDGEQHGAEHGDAQQRRAPQMKGLTTFSALGGL